MTARPKLYLAGPEVFLPEAIEIGRIKKDLCARYGIEGLYPFD
ncbi:MAG TPA: nucleoside 2-deoxyribosyltransferase, partial [Beijerinckiaceae bacterium]|nr:nucleoside 2-deoxyribosyltransferase [Beijerinckiaceae bacterium]